MSVPSFNSYTKYFQQPEADGYPIHLIEMGHLALPSGEIIASDPFTSYQQQPFSKQVMPGSYPVTLAVATIEEHHYRVGLAKVTFSETPATQWELAVSADILPEEWATLAPNEFIGYEVESGLGLFVDAQVNEHYVRVLDEFYNKREKANYYTEVLAKEFASFSGKHPQSRNLGDWNVHCPTTDPNLNVMMFATGWGDGVFPSYWGLDEEDNIVELITDFLVFGSFD